MGGVIFSVARASSPCSSHGHLCPCSPSQRRRLAAAGTAAHISPHVSRGVYLGLTPTVRGASAIQSSLSFRNPKQQARSVSAGVFTQRPSIRLPKISPATCGRGSNLPAPAIPPPSCRAKPVLSLPAVAWASLSKDRKFQIVNSKAKIHSHRLPNHAPNQGKCSIITNQ